MKPLKPSGVYERPRKRDTVQPEPEPEPEIVEEETETGGLDLSDVIQQQQAITLQQYLGVYSEVIRLKEENLKLRSKLITLQEDLKQWKEKKASKRSKLQGEELKNAFIDLLINSDLNIESIPDEVEREIYSFILNQVSAVAESTSIIRKLFFCG
jgi:molecular chaperone GrpE (heat shock protein)